MARFRFRLERVLDVSVQRVRAAGGELTRAVAAREAARQRLEALGDEVRLRRAELAGRLREGLRAWEWAVYAAYVGRLREAVRRAAEELAACEEAVEARRAELWARLRERRAFEALRRRALERHRQEEAAAAQRFLDEVGVTRRNRSGAGGRSWP